MKFMMICILILRTHLSRHHASSCLKSNYQQARDIIEHWRLLFDGKLPFSSIEDESFIQFVFLAELELHPST